MWKRIRLAGVLGVFLIIFMLIIACPKRTVQFETEGDNFYVLLNFDGRTEKISPWLDKEKGIYYFFLPSFVKEQKVYFSSVIPAQELLVDGVNMKRWSSLEWKKDNIYKVEIEDRLYLMTFMKGENIPSFFVKTESGSLDSIHSAKGYGEKGTLSVVGADGALQYAGGLEKISSRGNTTMLQEKKPYNIILDEKGHLGGLGTGKKWKLLALYFEQDKIHTKIIFDMAREIGLTYTPESTWVDLYCNGEYKGLYLLTESVDSHIESNKGYLIEKTGATQVSEEECSFTTDTGYIFKMKDPSYIDSEESEQLAEFVQNIENMIVEGDQDYKKYIDIDSLAKQFLIDKIVLEADAMSLSTYFFKDNNKNMLYAGPLWDYDRAIGERFPDYEIPIEGEPNGMNVWYMALYQDEEFYNAMINVYIKLLPYFEEILNTDIDNYAERIDASVEMDDVLMSTYETPIKMLDLKSYTDYESYIRYFKYFLAHRLNYLNTVWGIHDKDFSVPESSGKIHEVTFFVEGGTILETRMIMDGKCLKDLPVLEEEGYAGGWYFTGREGAGGLDKIYNEKIPIYEDTILYAEKLP